MPLIAVMVIHGLYASAQKSEWKETQAVNSLDGYASFHHTFVTSKYRNAAAEAFANLADGMLAVSADFETYKLLNKIEQPWPEAVLVVSQKYAEPVFKSTIAQRSKSHLDEFLKFGSNMSYKQRVDSAKCTISGEDAIRTGAIRALKEFLDDFNCRRIPIREEVEVARVKVLADIELEWSELSKTENILEIERFKEKYADTEFEWGAERRILELNTRSMESAALEDWNLVRKSRSVDEVELFLREHGDSKLAMSGQYLIRQLRGIHYGDDLEFDVVDRFEINSIDDYPLMINGILTVAVPRELLPCDLSLAKQMVHLE
ncbi:MAG: hypothetical protein IPL52_17515 [Flavobacteriales bacterium]|nr:hypothetical protein [Flavobacteriales bacterium]